MGGSDPDFSSESCYIFEWSSTLHLKLTGQFAIFDGGVVTVGDVYVPNVDLGQSISLPDTLSIPADVQVCDDSWATDDTYKVAYPPWAVDMATTGDVVINPSLDASGDITGDISADGNAITGAITGLWDWLKGILQSILDAIRSIPAAITAFIASLFDVTQFQLDFTPFKSLVIKDKFPFCIPFDFYDAIKSFAVSASDYQMRIDLETSYFEVHHTVDLSPFVIPIAFFRYAACVWFTLVLITRTKDLMKW